MHEIDSKTIETRSKFNVSEHLPVVSHSAHPAILNDGTILNVGLASSLTGMNYVLFEFPGLRDKRQLRKNSNKQFFSFFKFKS
jgi:hypothetical protein